MGLTLAILFLRVTSVGYEHLTDGNDNSCVHNTGSFKYICNQNFYLIGHIFLCDIHLLLYLNKLSGTKNVYLT